MTKSKTASPKAWVVTVDMGYGHQRATNPLKYLAYGGIIDANTYKGIPRRDRKTWHEQRKFYESISRFKSVPLVGDLAFNIFDELQKIPKFYPKRDLSRPSLQLRAAYRLLRQKGLGENLISKLNKRSDLPLVTSFFLTAFIAELFNYRGEIYCIICDADISRAWVALEPKQSKIKYFAPCQRVVERLQLYGVPKSRIFLTGFPLPLENIGSPALTVLKEDLKQRLVNLDPERFYLNKYQDTLRRGLDLSSFPKQSDHPLTITFAVGGAGAQREIGAEILKGLKRKIAAGHLRINLIAGIHRNVNSFFKQHIQKLGLQKYLGAEVRILYSANKQDYFKTFNHWLRQTDILWTKPSELAFYSGLGLPIVMCPPIGSQEEFNRKYLIGLGAGLDQEKMKYVEQWLFDWIASGRLAEAAAQGFLEAPKLGTYNIAQILAKHGAKTEKFKTISPY